MRITENGVKVWNRDIEWGHGRLVLACFQRPAGTNVRIRLRRKRYKDGITTVAWSWRRYGLGMAWGTIPREFKWLRP